MMRSHRGRFRVRVALVVVGCGALAIGCAGRPEEHGGTRAPHVAVAASPLATAAESHAGSAGSAMRCTAPAASANANANGMTLEVADVAADTAGLRCCTYLRRPTGATASRVAYVQNGMGIYSTADGDVAGIAPSALATGAFALLTIDKPGISVDETGKTTMNREVYRQHTLADLVTCGQHAIDWATSRPSIAKRATLVVHGHSEGAQMAVRMLAVAASSKPQSLLDRVELTVLTGLPMEPVVRGAERQLGIFMPFEVNTFHQALVYRDDRYLLDLGLGSRYLEHPTAHEALEGVMTDLAKRRPGLRVEVFHGDRDLNAPVELVRSFAEKNRRAREAGAPSLDMRLHVYKNAPHHLDARVDGDLAALVASLPRPGG